MNSRRVCSKFIDCLFMTCFGLWTLPTVANNSIQEPLSITEIKNCGASLTLDSNQISLFNHHALSLTGWSHITSDNKTTEFSGTALPSERYQFNSSNFRSDNSCNGLSTYNTVLVKKLADWHHQHANGLEINFSDIPVEVGSLKSLIIEFKVHKIDTIIPTHEELVKRFGAYLTEDQLHILDSENINFSLTLFEEGGNDQSTNSLNATALLSLPKASTLDRWLHVEIPVNALQFYNEQHYASAPVHPRDVRMQNFIGFRLNPESENGKVLRNLLNGQLPQDIIELFKEYQISIKTVMLVTHQ